jgi:transketolase
MSLIALQFDITPSGIARRGEKVVEFYKKRGQPVHSPLISALDDINDA